MGSIAITLIVFACAFGGALAGIVLRRLLPPHHLTPESKDTVKLGMGLVATMSARFSAYWSLRRRVFL